MKKYKIGYTQGTYDLFHIGHLNLLEHAKEKCDYLIVGVNADKLVKKYKNKIPIINEFDRERIIKALKVVDKTIITTTLDKLTMFKQLNFDVIFIGDDWKGNDRWKKTEKELAKYEIPVEYLPHTDGISTTELTQKIRNNKLREE